MSHITKTQRALSWNVQIFVGSTLVAGFLQRGQILKIKDVASDLGLCLEFPPPEELSPLDGAPSWQPALLSESSPDSRLLLLSESEEAPFIAPEPDTVDRYAYVFHSMERCADHKRQHALQDPCIRRCRFPNRRHNPAYLPIHKKSDNPLLATASLRSQISTSQSTTTSQDSGAPMPHQSCDETYPGELFRADEVATLLKTFRTDVMSQGSICAISGKGKFLPNVPGPGIQAAHIVPSCHWNVYPVDDDLAVASLSDAAELRRSWRRTWTVSNGLALQSILHQCFDGRLVSIHPTTHIVRAFVDYDITAEYHGKKAYLPHNIDVNALRHHYNMCCIENMVSAVVDDAVGVSGARTTMAPPPIPGSWTSKPAPGPSNTPNVTAPESSQHQSAPEGEQQGAVDAEIAMRPPTPPSSVQSGRGWQRRRHYVLHAGVRSRQARENSTSKEGKWHHESLGGSREAVGHWILSVPTNKPPEVFHGSDVEQPPPSQPAEDGTVDGEEGEPRRRSKMPRPVAPDDTVDVGFKRPRHEPVASDLHRGLSGSRGVS